MSGVDPLQRTTKRLTKLHAEQVADAELRAALDHKTEQAAHPIRGPPSERLAKRRAEQLANLPAALVLRRPQVEAVTGLSCSSIYAKMAEGKFPTPVRLGPKAVGWRRDDIEAWLAERPPARRARLKRAERAPESLID